METNNLATDILGTVSQLPDSESSTTHTLLHPRPQSASNTMTHMPLWGCTEHSDPDELKRQAEAAGSNAEEAAQLAARQEEIREVLDMNSLFLSITPQLTSVVGLRNVPL